MQRLFSPSAGQVFLLGLHHPIPADAFNITEAQEVEMIGNCPPGYAVSVGPDGELIHTPVAVPVPTIESLSQSIDRAADIARNQVVGDPLRGEEYKLAAAEAQAFAAAGYPAAEVPRTVAAWVSDTRTPQQAADHILTEAAQYNEALYQLRETRLQAKELVRQAMAAGQVEQAQDIAAETIASIEAAVVGVGNNAQ